MKENRPYEKRLYELFISKIGNERNFPVVWEEFIEPIRQQINYEGILNDIERNILWQAGTSFKIGCSLIEDKKLNGHSFPQNAIEASALQLIVFGTFLQLKGWVHKLRGEKSDHRMLGKIKKYISEDFNLKELRNAIAHSGDNENNTYFCFGMDQTIKFRTKQTTEEKSIETFEILFASLLLWIVFSEWASKKIK